MKKKILGILVFLMVIIPIQPAFGISQNIRTKSNIESKEASIDTDIIERRT